MGEKEVSSLEGSGGVPAVPRDTHGKREQDTNLQMGAMGFMLCCV